MSTGGGALLFVVTACFFLVAGGVFAWALSILGSWRAPFVPLPHASLPKIAEMLALAPGLVVYDIGCGDGRVLRACAKREPNAVYKGIERALFPWFLARIARSKRIAYTRGNLFHATYHDADRIVLYLLPELVEEVWKKLVRECRPGTRVVSVDFPLKSVNAQEIYEQRNLSPRMRGRMIYVYEIPSQ